MLVKAAFVLLVLSIGAIVVAAIAMRWRLRRHMRNSHDVPPAPALEIEQQEPVEKT